MSVRQSSATDVSKSNAATAVILYTHQRKCLFKGLRSSVNSVQPAGSEACDAQPSLNVFDHPMLRLVPLIRSKRCTEMFESETIGLESKDLKTIQEYGAF